MKKLFKRLFHKCGEHLEYIEGSRLVICGLLNNREVPEN